MKRNIAGVRMHYFMLRLSLLVIAVVTLFVTRFILPPIIVICITCAFALTGSLSSILLDRSASQKRE